VSEAHVAQLHEMAKGELLRSAGILESS